MDAGIIKNLKHLYRNEIVRKNIASLDVEEDFNINLFQALFMLDAAWKFVTTKTIKKIFQHVGFTLDMETDQDQDDPECFVVEVYQQMESWSNITLEEYIDCNALLVTSEFTTEVTAATDDTAADEQPSEDEIFEVNTISIKDAIDSIGTLENIFLQQQDGLEAIGRLYKLRDQILQVKNKRKTQTSITSFFNST